MELGVGVAVAAVIFNALSIQDQIPGSKGMAATSRKSRLRFICSGSV